MLRLTLKPVSCKGPVKSHVQIKPVSVFRISRDQRLTFSEMMSLPCYAIRAV